MSNTSAAASMWLVAGLRTPFAKVDGSLSDADAIDLSLPVVRSMLSPKDAAVRPDLVVWGTVASNLGYSNLAREVLI
ncbi:MAG: acetyl-CoA C-acyltransferase, partial [Gemmatimonadales bacterium]